VSQVNVTINGKVYRIACDDGQEGHLNTLAGRLDGTIQQLRTAFGEIGDQRLTVMAAIMVMDEAADTERRLAAAEAELAQVRDLKTAVAERLAVHEARVAERVAAAAERLERLAGALTSRPQVG
jgi:cell division protein ZapA